MDTTVNEPAVPHHHGPLSKSVNTASRFALLNQLGGKCGSPIPVLTIIRLALTMGVTAPINNSPQSRHFANANQNPAPQGTKNAAACPLQATGDPRGLTSSRNIADRLRLLEKENLQPSKKRPRSQSPEVKKGKMKAVERLERFLEDYEEELSCPMCVCFFCQPKGCR